MTHKVQIGLKQVRWGRNGRFATAATSISSTWQLTKLFP